MEHLRRYLEQSAFGVCAYLADRMGIPRVRVRQYFLYISCLTLGSPLLFYFFAAFWLNFKRYARQGKRTLVG